MNEVRLIKVAAAVVNQTPFDWDSNKTNILNALEDARLKGARLVCFPELSITGYGCEDDFFRIDLHERAWRMLEELLPSTYGLVVSLGLPVLHNNALFNCAVLVVDGKIAGIVPKQNLAGDGIHYEPRWFQPWPEGVVSHAEKSGTSIPIGDIHFCLGGVKLGFEICEDAWVGRRPGGKLAAFGIDILLNPSASHFSFGKLQTRQRLVVEGSRAFMTSYIYTNLLGNEAGRAIYDGGAIVASGGELVAIGPRLSFADYEVTTAIIDLDFTRMLQARTFSFRHDVKEDNSCIEVDFTFPPIDNELVPPRTLTWEHSQHIKEEEFARSVSLGLFDYLRKTRSLGYVVSLSGGADSSAVCTLVYLMVALAVQEIGLEGFKQKLGHHKEIQSADSIKSIVSRLLTAAYQSTRNSSEGTHDSAEAVAAALGATFYDFDIDTIIDAYTGLVSKAIGRELSFQTDDIALQNIQARARNPGIWLLANITGGILLCTSNRSEGAVGYCTMDGDTSGGLAPIAGVDKNFIRHWLRWMQSHGPHSLGPLPALKVVTEQAPGPELRPLELKQTAEKDLMPYDLLDAVEEASIEYNRSPADCFLHIRQRFPQYDAQQLGKWIEKFFLLWSRNQWKRERLAPALHVASRNLDPRTWRRTPILSGGFKRELEQMWQLIYEIENRRRGSVSSAMQSGDRALLIVDAQIGFGSNGELPVPDAEAIVPVINKVQRFFPMVVATQDWHPQDHVSFAATHKGKKPGDWLEIDGVKQPLFPPHCVAETQGANFIPELDTSHLCRIFRKGTASGVDAFSAFMDSKGGKATEIADYLRQKGVKELFITGLATNYCVEATALDAVNEGFRVFVIEDACRGIDSPPGAVRNSLEKMRRAGIQVIASDELVAAYKQSKTTA